MLHIKVSFVLLVFQILCELFLIKKLYLNRVRKVLKKAPIVFSLPQES